MTCMRSMRVVLHLSFQHTVLLIYLSGAEPITNLYRSLHDHNSLDGLQQSEMIGWWLALNCLCCSWLIFGFSLGQLRLYGRGWTLGREAFLPAANATFFDLRFDPRSLYSRELSSFGVIHSQGPTCLAKSAYHRPECGNDSLPIPFPRVSSRKFHFNTDCTLAMFLLRGGSLTLLALRNSDSKRHIPLRESDSLRAVVKSFELSRNVKAHRQLREWAGPSFPYSGSPSMRWISVDY